MSIKQTDIEGIGPVTFQKRRGTRSVRINIQGHNVKVTLPHWISYREAEKFVLSRREWINKHKDEKLILADGALIGKRFQLNVTNEDIEKPKTRILKESIQVRLPLSVEVEDELAQKAIEKACERALTREAKELLTPRITDLAFEHGFEYSSLHMKKLQRRWGSCDVDKHIILNIFLTQLPWELIDYVILHELTHTRHLHHGPDFWGQLSELIPNAKELRKELHEYHPQLLPR